MTTHTIDMSVSRVPIGERPLGHNGSPPAPSVGVRKGSAIPERHWAEALLGTLLRRQLDPPGRHKGASIDRAALTSVRGGMSQRSTAARALGG